MDGIAIIEVVKNTKSDFIRIHIGKSYLNLAIEDIPDVKVSKPIPFGTSVNVVLTTPFGEFELDGKKAVNALKKIARNEPNMRMCL